MSDAAPTPGRTPAGSRPRLTPYELAFGEPVFEATTWPALLREAENADVDPAERQRFSFLSVGSDALREVIPPDAPAEALDQYRALLFHAFNFWRLGRRVYLAEPAVARFLVESAPDLGGWRFALPYPSVYVQLPANLFWASITPDSTPEPVDGFFATVADEADPLDIPFQRLEVLMVLGIRRERAGFSVIPFDTEVGRGIAPPWLAPEGRDTGKDFENTLPGGELSGLYSILTTAEAFKLLARVFWYTERNPTDVVLEEGTEGLAPEDADADRVSRLPVHRIRLARPADAAGGGA